VLLTTRNVLSCGPIRQLRRKVYTSMLSGTGARAISSSAMMFFSSSLPAIRIILDYAYEIRPRVGNLLILLVLVTTPLLLSGCKFEQISPEVYRGSIPGKERMQELKSMGVKTIINLRTNSMPKHARWARELGLNYFHIRTGVFKIPAETEVEKFLSIVRNPDYQPVYVCCTLATDRTACYAGIYRVAQQKWSPEQAYAEMDEKGLKEWWPIFRKYIKTFHIVQQYDEQVSRTGAPESPTSLRRVDVDLTVHGSVSTTTKSELPANDTGRGVAPPTEGAVSTSGELLDSDRHEELPKKSGFLMRARNSGML